jgi:hypothetical protein
MMRKVIALFDEYQSKENAKHVIRSMKENARQGFWNGATPPLGYRLIEDLLHCMRVSYTERAFPLQEYGQERVTAGVVFTYRCDAVAGVIAVEPEQRLPDAVGPLFE